MCIRDSHHLVSVVVLRRDPISIARSFFELDYMGLTNAPWPDFMPPPTAPASMFHIPADKIRSRFDLIFGYLIDFEIRSQTLREQAPSARWIDTRLEEITTVEGATRLFDRLRVPTPPQLAEIVNRKVNVKQKTAYEMDSCLVGSEMCIRDSHVVEFEEASCD